jgi:hypothetical protein
MMVLKNNCIDMKDFIMSVNCYNGKFVITAKSLETNVAVVMRVDCKYLFNFRMIPYLLNKVLIQCVLIQSAFKFCIHLAISK